MTRLIGALLLGSALLTAGCGADGEPERPASEPRGGAAPMPGEPGVRLSGDARIGVTWRE